MKVLVTGNSGWLGRPQVPCLRRDGARWSMARRRPHIETHDNAEFVAVNLQGTLNLLEK